MGLTKPFSCQIILLCSACSSSRLHYAHYFLAAPDISNSFSLLVSHGVRYLVCLLTVTFFHCYCCNKMPLKIQILDCLTDFSKAMKLESLDVTDYEIALIMMKVVTLRT